MMNNSLNKEISGFTLIELVVVIVILGILSAFAIPRFYNMKDNAWYASFKSSIGAIKSGVANVYTMKHGEYPSVTELVTDSYMFNGETFEIMGMTDFELSQTAPSGVELIGSLPAQPASGTWEELYVYSPSQANAKYYTKVWYNADTGSLVDGL